MIGNSTIRHVRAKAVSVVLTADQRGMQLRAALICRGESGRRMRMEGQLELGNWITRIRYLGRESFVQISKDI